MCNRLHKAGCIHLNQMKTMKPTRKLLTTFLVLFCCIGTLQAQANLSALLPMPNQATTREGKVFQFNGKHSVFYTNDRQLAFTAERFQAIVAQEMQVHLTPSDKPDAPIQLLIDTQLQGEQHYQIQIDHQRLLIKGKTPQAVFYGVMTFHQILLGDQLHTLQQAVSPIRIDDKPRFAYRALMLDPARHFLPVNDVKHYLDQMARYKYNVLQLHLTDDQGWRMEIKSHPTLASQQHYTQKELAELVRYAAERHIELVPEMDIPGHTVAMLTAYPELGCTSSDTIAKEVGKTTNLMLCAGVEKVYDIYRDIFREVAQVFPSNYIHLGGDESAIATNWERCDRCQQLMKEKGYKEASQLMIPFFDKMLSMVRQNGKSPILWCELDRIYAPANEYLFPYPKDVTLVTWRNGLTPKCIELTRRHGNTLLMAPGEYTYFDYPQLKGDLPEFNNWGMPVTTLEQAYKFDPGYGLPAKEQAHINGVMGTLWGEAMPDINRVTYMSFPRALALAEAGWTQMEHRSWDSFKKRMYPNLYLLMREGVSVRVPFEIVERK